VAVATLNIECNIRDKNKGITLQLSSLKGCRRRETTTKRHIGYNHRIECRIGWDILQILIDHTSEIIDPLGFRVLKILVRFDCDRTGILPRNGARIYPTCIIFPVGGLTANDDGPERQRKGQNKPIVVIRVFADQIDASRSEDAHRGPGPEEFLEFGHRGVDVGAVGRGELGCLHDFMHEMKSEVVCLWKSGKQSWLFFERN
jgi:hypothetical protein